MSGDPLLHFNKHQPMMPHSVTPFALLRASSEPIRFAQGQLREGAGSMG
jgi:hypothetical protein